MTSAYISVPDPDDEHGMPIYEGPSTAAWGRLEPGLYLCTIRNETADGEDAGEDRDAAVWVSTDGRSGVARVMDTDYATVTELPAGHAHGEPLDLTSPEVVGMVSALVHAGMTGNGTIHVDTDAPDDDTEELAAYFTRSVLRSLADLYAPTTFARPARKGATV